MRARKWLLLSALVHSLISANDRQMKKAWIYRTSTHVDLRLCKLPESEIAGNGTYNDLMPRISLSLKIYLTIYCVFVIIALDELAEPLRGLV